MNGSNKLNGSDGKKKYVTNLRDFIQKYITLYLLSLLALCSLAGVDLPVLKWYVPEVGVVGFGQTYTIFSQFFTLKLHK